MAGWDLYDLDISHMFAWYDLDPSHVYAWVGFVGSAHVYLGGIRMICMICTFVAGWDLYDLDLMHNFSISAKNDLDDLDHDLSEV